MNTRFGSVTNNWGHLVYAIDPLLLVNPEEYKRQVTELVVKIKATRKLPGVEEIFVPGERGDRLTKQRLDSGEIEVEDNLLKQLKEVAKPATKTV